MPRNAEPEQIAWYAPLLFFGGFGVFCSSMMVAMGGGGQDEAGLPLAFFGGFGVLSSCFVSLLTGQWARACEALLQNRRNMATNAQPQRTWYYFPLCFFGGFGFLCTFLNFEGYDRIFFPDVFRPLVCFGGFGVLCSVVLYKLRIQLKWYDPWWVFGGLGVFCYFMYWRIPLLDLCQLGGIDLFCYRMLIKKPLFPAVLLDGFGILWSIILRLPTSQWLDACRSVWQAARASLARRRHARHDEPLLGGAQQPRPPPIMETPLPWQILSPSAPPMDQTSSAPPMNDVMSKIPESEVATGDMPTCPVCMTNRMDMALGCGHRICGTCLKLVNQQLPPARLCPVCRTAISNVIRLYN